MHARRVEPKEERSVEAMKAGGHDFLTKQYKQDDLLAAIGRVAKTSMIRTRTK